MRKIINLNDNWNFSKNRINWEHVKCYYHRQLQTPSL